MLSIGWPEMMIVAAAALIIVGPRDLPALLRNIGQMAGKARRMSNEFRAELNKVAALDDVKDIKNSITQPLKETQRSIQSEFNKITPTGVEPSENAIKPKDPNAQSVYDEIKSATKSPGAPTPPPQISPAKPEAKPKRTARKPASSKSAAAKSAAAAKTKPAAGKSRTAARGTGKTTRAKPTTAKPSAKPATRKPRAKKAD